MLRLGLWLLFASVGLTLVGWLSLAHWVFEVIRAAAMGSLALGMLLLLVEYLRTPDPAER